MNELQATQKTMNSNEIAELCGKTHKNVKADIRRVFSEAGIGGDNFLSTFKTESGQNATIYTLYRRECDLVVSGYSVKYRLKIIDRWHDLENKILQVPQTMSEALKLAYEQSLTIEKQQKSIEAKDTLIIASNEASIKAGEILVRELVKSQDLIHIGERKFYAWMRAQKILQENSREPYQYFVDRGYFTYKPTEDKHGGKFRYTLRVTPRGKVWLSARFLNWQDKQDIGM